MKVRYMGITNEAEALKAVERDGNALKYVRDQTEAVCLKAVERDGDALMYVFDPELFKKISAAM